MSSEVVTGVPVDTTGRPIETTPLVGQSVTSVSTSTGQAVGVPVRQQSSGLEEASEALRENKEAGSAGGAGACGALGAIICLVVYYNNDGDHAECSTQLPLFLKVSGFAGVASMVLGAVVSGGIATKQTNPCFLCLVGFLSAIGGALGCFLFVWLILGLVWFSKTSATQCDAGLYEGTRIYFIVVLVVPLAICSCVCCCLCCFFAAKAKAEGGSGSGSSSGGGAAEQRQPLRRDERVPPSPANSSPA